MRVQVYFDLPRRAAGLSSVVHGGRRLQQARAKVTAGAVTGSDRDGQPLRTRQLFDRCARICVVSM